MSNREPYVGPRPFQREEQDFFFGRDDESNDLVSLITAHPIVLLYAQSGAGKTSLLNAKVIPMLEQDEFDVLGPLRVTREHTPGLDFNQVNLYMFNALSGKLRREGELSSLAQLPLDEYLKKTYAASEGRLLKPCVIIFDQFEELFTFYPERWKDRRGFFEQISKALEDPLLRVVLAMREDYIAELDPYEDLLPEQLRTRFRLERLREEAALLAVEGPLKEGPLKQNGFGFAPGVAEKLVNDLLTIPFESITDGSTPKGEYIEAVQLQVVCRTLWKKLQPSEKTITHEHLKAHGDVNTALSAFYEECVEAAKESAEKEWAIRNWFERKLITETGKRGKVFRGPQKTGGLSNVAVDKLEELHIIKPEVSGGERWYELSHDRFIQPVLKSNKEWLVERSSAVSTRKHLEEKAARGELLDESELLEAKRWLDSPVAAEMDIADAVRGLIVISEAAIAVKKAAQQREVEMAQTIAEAERLRAEAQAQRAEDQQQRAEAERLRAEAQARRAEAESQRAEAQAQRAEAQARRAEAESQRAEAERLRAEAESLKTQAERKRVRQLRWGLALLSFLLLAALTSTVIALTKTIAAEGARLREAEQREIAQGKAREAEAALADKEVAREQAAEEAQKALIARREAIKRLEIIERIDKDTPHNKLTLRGRKDEALLTVSNDGTVLIWDPSAGADQQPILLDPDPKKKDPDPAQPQNSAQPQINDAVLSPDGKLVATAKQDYTVRISEAPTGKLLTQLSGHRGPVNTVAFSHRDDKLLVTASSDGTARVWDTKGEMLQTLAGGRNPLLSAQFSPDNKLVLTISEDKKAILWDLAEGKQKTTLDGPVTKADFSPDGNFIVTVSGNEDDQTARLWEAETGKPRAELRGHTGHVNSAVFSKDKAGRYIVTASEDGTSRVWRANRQGLLKLVTGHTLKELREHTGLLVSYARKKIFNTIPFLEFSMIHKPAVNDITCAAFRPEEGESKKPRYVVTGSKDGTAKLWEIKTGRKITEFRGHIGPIKSVDFSPDGNLVVTAGNDATVRVWDPCKGINPTDLKDRVCEYCERIGVKKVPGRCNEFLNPP